MKDKHYYLYKPNLPNKDRLEMSTMHGIALMYEQLKRLIDELEIENMNQKQLNEYHSVFYKFQQDLHDIRRFGFVPTKSYREELLGGNS